MLALATRDIPERSLFAAIRQRADNSSEGLVTAEAPIASLPARWPPDMDDPPFDLADQR